MSHVVTSTTRGDHKQASSFDNAEAKSNLHLMVDII
jgi:hypothetical protein